MEQVCNTYKWKRNDVGTRILQYTFLLIPFSCFGMSLDRYKRNLYL